MVGLCSVGVHIPWYRIDRKMIAEATGTPARKGERTVANYDEDSITMAVEAGFNCLKGQDLDGVDALYFASTSSPYREKQAAAIISKVFSLGEHTLTADFLGTVRAGTIALKMGSDSINTGTARKVLLLAADSRLGEPGSELEQSSGDGGAAILIGNKDVIATVEGFHTWPDTFTDYWRKSEDRFVRAGDGRFIQSFGYAERIKKSISETLKAHELNPSDVTRLVSNSPDAMTLTRLAKSLDMAHAVQGQALLFDSVGNCGVASVFLGLQLALEESEPGDLLLVANYGDGGDCVLLRVTEEIEKFKKKRMVTDQLNHKKLISGYQKYLTFKDIVGESSYEAFSTLSLLWRQERQFLQFIGTKCLACSTIRFPASRVCQTCGAKDQFQEVPLSKRGKVFTYTKDHIYINPDPPLVMAAVDLEGGGRFFGQVSDCDPDSVQIGTPVRITFRKLHEGGGYPNYFWKSRPLRGAE